MPRMEGLEPRDASFLTRVIYSMVRRKMGKLVGQNRLVEPIKIMAHHPRVLRAVGQMEMAQEGATTVPATLKSLAQIRTASLVGCPF